MSPPLPLLLMFSLPHKLFSLVWGKIHHKPIFSYKVVFLLEMVYSLGFQAVLRGWRPLGPYWVRCVFPESITKGDSVFVLLQPQVLLHSSWPSPRLQPTAHRGRRVCQLVCIINTDLRLTTWAHSCPFLLSHVTSKSISFPWLPCFVFCCHTRPLVSLFSSLTAYEVF